MSEQHSPTNTTLDASQHVRGRASRGKFWLNFEADGCLHFGLSKISAGLRTWYFRRPSRKHKWSKPSVQGLATAKEFRG